MFTFKVRLKLCNYYYHSLATFVNDCFYFFLSMSIFTFLISYSIWSRITFILFMVSNFLISFVYRLDNKKKNVAFLFHFSVTKCKCCKSIKRIDNIKGWLLLVRSSFIALNKFTKLTIATLVPPLMPSMFANAFATFIPRLFTKCNVSSCALNIYKCSVNGHVVSWHVVFILMNIINSCELDKQLRLHIFILKPFYVWFFYNIACWH